MKILNSDISEAENVKMRRNETIKKSFLFSKIFKETLSVNFRSVLRQSFSCAGCVGWDTQREVGVNRKTTHKVTYNEIISVCCHCCFCVESRSTQFIVASIFPFVSLIFCWTFKFFHVVIKTGADNFSTNFILKLNLENVWGLHDDNKEILYNIIKKLSLFSVSVWQSSHWKKLHIFSLSTPKQFQWKLFVIFFYTTSLSYLRCEIYGKALGNEYEKRFSVTMSEFVTPWMFSFETNRNKNFCKSSGNSSGLSRKVGKVFHFINVNDAYYADFRSFDN